eukprot:scaffold10136_cov58-Phaeocystis_antarctica.AAC.3
MQRASSVHAAWSLRRVCLQRRHGLALLATCTTHHSPLTTDHRLPTTDDRRLTTDYRLVSGAAPAVSPRPGSARHVHHSPLTTHHRPPTTDYRRPTTHHRLPTSEWRGACSVATAWLCSCSRSSSCQQPMTMRG